MPRQSRSRSAPQAHTLEVQGRQVPLSNLEKVLYPGTGFTKAQVIDYYIRVSPYLLPHLKDRPVTLKRYPDGVRGEHFYEKDAPGFTPEWVQTFPVPRRAGGPDIRYILLNDLPTLVWSANLGEVADSGQGLRFSDVLFQLRPFDNGVGTSLASNLGWA